MVELVIDCLYGVSKDDGGGSRARSIGSNDIADSINRSDVKNQNRSAVEGFSSGDRIIKRHLKIYFFSNTVYPVTSTGGEVDDSWYRRIYRYPSVIQVIRDLSTGWKGGYLCCTQHGASSEEVGESEGFGETIGDIGGVGMEQDEGTTGIPPLHRIPKNQPICPTPFVIMGWAYFRGI